MTSRRSLLILVVAAAASTIALCTFPSNTASAPQASSPSKWNGTKWEYKFVRVADPNPEAKLNENGSEGWELVSAVGGLIFKRPLAK